jgi:hypothetical protein
MSLINNELLSATAVKSEVRSFVAAVAQYTVRPVEIVLSRLIVKRGRGVAPTTGET